MRRILLFSAAFTLTLLFIGTCLAEVVPTIEEEASVTTFNKMPTEVPNSDLADNSLEAGYSASISETREIVLSEPLMPTNSDIPSRSVEEYVEKSSSSEATESTTLIMSSGSATPTIIDEPKTPSEFTLPEIPDKPETPSEFIMPTIPDKPETPSEPLTPTIPDKPEILSEPLTPTIPDKPEIPSEPTTPTIPDKPEIPSEPLTPTIPDKPEIPSEPLTPTIPDKPEIPQELVTPITPDEPEVPEELVTPTIPEELETPQEPVIPTTEDESEIPSELVTPVIPDEPATEEATAPKLMSFETRDIKGPGKKGSISGSVSVETGHTVIVELTGNGIDTQYAVLSSSSNSFEFKDLDAGEYTITIYDAASPSLKLVLKQKVNGDSGSDTPTAITDLSAKAGPNRITVTGKAEANRAIVIGTDPASQEVTVVSSSDGKFTATLTCAAGTYKIWAQYANLKDTKVTMSGSIVVEDEKIDNYPTFSRGDRYHPLIYRLQQRLKELGYYTIKVDGIYGSGTERAVRLFQQVNGIHPANGVATNHTQQVLYSHSAKPFHEVIPWHSGSTLYRSPYYQAAVVPLQQRLRALGYYTGSADGYYGSRTQQAVRNFQKRNGLPVTGTADPVTQQKLYSSSAIPASGGGYTPTPSTGYRLLYWGCRGDAVRRLQQALIAAGYTQVRTVDGIYGKWTYDAVRAFQRDHGLSVDGIAGRKTQNALYGTHY